MWFYLVLCLIGQVFSDQCESTGPGVCREDIFPYPYDCSKYWECTMACILYVRDCAPPLHFSADLKVCVSPNDANCQATTTIAPSTTTVVTTESTTEGPTTTTTTEPTTTYTGPVTSALPANPSMFFVGRSTNYDGPEAIVDFDVSVMDRRGDFDLVTDRFVAPTTGTYYFALSCGVRGGSQTNYRLEDDNLVSFANARRLSRAHGSQDIISRDVILPLNKGDIQLMKLATDDGLFSNDQLQTSFAGFSLHDSMTLVSAFSVAINKNTTVQGVVDFNITLTNVNNDFNPAINAYIAPTNGVYVFSLSAGLARGEPVRVRLLVNGVAAGFELWREHSGHTADDTISRSVLVNLNAGDSVQYELVSGTLWSNTRHQTSLSGFLYNPRFLSDPAAWFVSRDTSWVSSGIFDDLSPVDYNVVTLNLRNLYNPTSNEVVIPEAGFYYLHFGVGSEREYLIRDRDVDLTLVKREPDGTNTFLVDLVRDATDFVGVDTVSRAAIYELNKGDVLYMSAAAGSAFSGDNFRALTYFMGLMFYSTE